jgi:hypothetical protein
VISFLKKQLQATFEKDGFVVFDLLNGKEVEELQAHYERLKKLHVNPDQTLFSSLDNDNPALGREVEQAIQSVCLPPIKREIAEFDYLFSTFLIKKSAENNPTPFHQDPTLIDEEPALSANLWIALEDTHENNGALRFVPGSHRITETLVVTPDFYTFYHEYPHKLSPYCVDVKLKKGQAVIFNNKLVHGAYPNESGKDRIAAVVALKSKNSPWCYYYMPNKAIEGSVEKYYLNKAHYSEIKKNHRPESYIDKEIIQHKFPVVSFRSFQKFMFQNYPSLAIKALFKSILK